MADSFLRQHYHVHDHCVAIGPGSKEKVDEFYHKAIELGAVDEGEPGQRIEDMFYGAYCRDPDGNKVCFHQFG